MRPDLGRLLPLSELDLAENAQNFAEGNSGIERDRSFAS